MKTFERGEALSFISLLAPLAAEAIMVIGFCIVLAAVMLNFGII